MAAEAHKCICYQALPKWLSGSSYYLLAETLFADISLRIHKGDFTELLSDPKVERFIALTSCGGCASLTTIHVKNVVSLGALFHFATLCRVLPDTVTKGLFTECSSCFLTLLRGIGQSFTIGAGVNLEEFLSFVVMCGVQLRGSRNIALAAFDKQVVDNALCHALPQGPARSQHSIGGGIDAWGQRQKDVALGIISGIRKASLALCSHSILPQFISAIPLEIISLAEQIATKSKSVAALSDFEQTLLLECLMALCTVDQSVSSRVLTLATRLATPSEAFNAVFQSNPLVVKIISSALLLLLRFSTTTGAQQTTNDELGAALCNIATTLADLTTPPAEGLSPTSQTDTPKRSITIATASESSRGSTFSNLNALNAATLLRVVIACEERRLEVSSSSSASSSPVVPSLSCAPSCREVDAKLYLLLGSLSDGSLHLFKEHHLCQRCKKVLCPTERPLAFAAPTLWEGTFSKTFRSIIAMLVSPSGIMTAINEHAKKSVSQKQFCFYEDPRPLPQSISSRSGADELSQFVLLPTVTSNGGRRGSDAIGNDARQALLYCKLLQRAVVTDLSRYFASLQSYFGSPSTSLMPAVTLVATEVLHRSVDALAAFTKEVRGSSTFPSLDEDIPEFLMSPDSAYFVLRALCISFVDARAGVVEELSDMIATRKPTAVRSSSVSTPTTSSNHRDDDSKKAGGKAGSPPNNSSSLPFEVAAHQQQWAVLQLYSLSLLSAAGCVDVAMHCSGSLGTFGASPTGAFDVALVKRVLQVLFDQFSDSLREEVLKGRTLPTAASVGTPNPAMFMSASIRHVLQCFGAIVASLEMRQDYLLRTIEEDYLLGAAKLNGRHPEDDTSVMLSTAQRNRVEKSRQLLQIDMVVLQEALETLLQLSLSVGWVGSGWLYLNYRADLQPFSSVGDVLKVILIPILPLISSLQALSVAASTATSLLESVLVGGTLIPSDPNFVNRWPWRNTFDGNTDRTSFTTEYSLTFSSAAHDESTLISQRFRSFWLMLTCYGISTSAADHFAKRVLPPAEKKVVDDVLPASPLGIAAAGSSTVAGSFYTAMHSVMNCGVDLDKQLTNSVRRVAVSSPPLLHMRSTDCQQVFAELASVERHLGPRLAADVQKAAVANISKVCPPVANVLYRGNVTFVEALLLRSVADLEVLRCVSGIGHVHLFYAHLEIREFVSSKTLIDALLAVMQWLISPLYISSVSRMIAFEKASRLRKDCSALILFAAFGTNSVRHTSLAALREVINAFPHICTQFDLLALLLGAVNVLQLGDEEEIIQFSASHFYKSVAIATTTPYATDRQLVHYELLTFASEWVALGKQSAPHRLFESGLEFILEQESFNFLAISHFSGTELAMRACGVDRSKSPSAPVVQSAAQQGNTLTDEFSGTIPCESRKGVLVLSASRLRNYAHTLMRRSRASGNLEAAMRYQTYDAVEADVVQRLVYTMRDGMGALATAPKLSERTILKMAALSGGGSERQHRTASSSQAAVRGAVDLVSTLAESAALLNTGKMSAPLVTTLLRYITQGPVQLFSSVALHSAVSCWKWLLTGGLKHCREHTRELLSNVCAAFEWTVSQRLGLFDGANPSQLFQVETGCIGLDAVPFLRKKKTMSCTSDEVCSELYASDYASNSPHKILIAFLAEMFVDRKFEVSLDPAVLRILFRLATVITRDPSQLSLKDVSFGEFMRVVLFVFHIIENIHLVNVHIQQQASQRKKYLPTDSIRAPALVVPFGCLVSLRRKATECLIRWFSKTPPSFYMATEPTAVAMNEHSVMAEIMSILVREQERLAVSPRGFLPRGDEEVSAAVDTLSMPSTGRRASSMVGSVRPSGMPPLAPPASVKSSAPPVSDGHKKVHNTLGLLKLMLKHESTRLLLWHNPRVAQQTKDDEVSPQLWKAYCEAAAAESPEVLVALSLRFPNPTVQRYASAAVAANPSAFAHIAAAVDLYINDASIATGLQDLYLWSNCSIIQSLRYLDETYQPFPHIVRYAIRSLLSAESKHLIFYLPQLLQCLSHDRSGSIEGFFCTMCKHSTEFTHQLLWCLQTEGEGDGELAKKCTALSNLIIGEMTPEQRVFYEEEFHYIAGLIRLSGELKPVEKPKRKERLRSLLKERVDVYHKPLETSNVYIPTNPDCKIVEVIPHTAGAMQSAAKCPILVQFVVEPRNPEEIRQKGNQQKPKVAPNDTIAVIKKACIFKMGDDCRQDQIALQIIQFIKQILLSVSMPCFLCPYRVVTTGKSSGVIECVPNAMSRDQIGKLVESNLAEYFVQTYGHPETPAFRKARKNFILSMASYSVASYILNIKDRHNGNIMLDAEGHLIHIDFGFIFDYSPGGDMNFESSPFKLTQEMLQLMGDSVSGAHTVKSAELSQALLDPESYELFVQSTVLCYLAVRQFAREICILVELMLLSGLPCFKPKKTIADLAQRLSMQRTESEAASFMFARIMESRDNMRTRLYDRYQNIAEGIEM